MIHRTRRFRTWTLAIAGAAALTLGTGMARAQIGSDISRSPTINEQQRGSIERFVEQQRPRLTGESGTARRQARSAVIAPLADPEVTFAFRQAYARVLMPVVRELVGSDDRAKVYTGLVIAGDLATEDSTTLVREHLGHDSEPVRLFAAGRAERVLSAVASRAPAISADATAGLVRELGTLVRNDPSTPTVDAAVRALGAGTRIERSDFQSVRFLAVRELARAVGERARSSSPDIEQARELTVYLRAAAIVRQALSDVAVRPPEDAARDSIGLGGDLIALVFNRHQDGQIGEDRGLDVQILSEAENIVYFGASRLSELADRPFQVAQTNLAARLRDGQDRELRQGVVGLIGAAGVLTDRPYGFPNDRFLGGG